MLEWEKSGNDNKTIVGSSHLLKAITSDMVKTNELIIEFKSIFVAWSDISVFVYPSLKILAINNFVVSIANSYQHAYIFITHVLEQKLITF